MARKITGRVVSDKADKTIVIAETVRKTHPIYKKQYSRTNKYIAHDEKNEANVGDTVEVVETRPISKRKSLTLVQIVEKAKISAKDTVEAITAEPKEEAKVDKTEDKKTKKSSSQTSKKEVSADKEKK